MHIAFISHMPWADTYGASTALRASVEALIRESSGLQISVIAPQSSRPEILPEVGSVEVFHYRFPMEMNFHGCLPRPQKDLWNVLYRRRLKGMAQQLPDSVRAALSSADVIHLNSLTLAWVIPALRSSLNRPTVPVLLHVREFLESNPANATASSILAPDGYLFIDATVKAHFTDGVSIPPSKPSWIISDIIASLDDAPEQPARVRRETPVVQLAVTGRLDPAKGAAFVADLMARPEAQDWQLDVVGSASRHPLRRGPRRQLRRISKACMTTAGRVRYLGEVPDLMSKGFYQTIDVLVRGDSLPAVGLNVYEALASGASVVLPGQAGDFSDYARITGSPERVAFATPRDPDSYISAIQSLMKGPIRAEPADLRAEEQMLNMQHVGNLMEAYQEVIDRTQGQSIPTKT